MTKCQDNHDEAAEMELIVRFVQLTIKELTNHPIITTLAVINVACSIIFWGTSVAPLWMHYGSWGSAALVLISAMIPAWKNRCQNT